MMTELLRQALITLSTAAERELEDIETGVEDGTYDDDEGNAERVAALKAALQAVAPFTAEPASEPAPLQTILVSIEKGGPTEIEGVPPGYRVEVRRYPGAEQWDDEYRSLSEEALREEGLTFDGKAWYFSEVAVVEGGQ